MPTPPDRLEEIEQQLQELYGKLTLAELELAESMRILELYKDPKDVEQ